MSQTYSRNIRFNSKIVVGREQDPDASNFDPIGNSRQKFEAWIKDDLPGRSEMLFGTTEKDQLFCFVLITLNSYFEVRLYMDEDHRENKVHFHWYQYYEENKFLETEKFMSRNEAINYIKMRKSSLEKNLHKEKRQVRIYCMPKECLTNPDKYLKPGDHIQTPLSVPLINGIAHHEGIYIGDGQVIHIAIDKVSFAHGVREKGRSCARVGLLKQHFANSSDADIKVVVYRIRFKTPDEIVSNAYRYAKEFFREGEYNVLWKNCQHFASLCAVGKEEMTDKKPLIVTGLTVVGVGLAAIGGVALAAYMTGGSSNNDNDDEDD